jgi:hypothetical protein
VTPVVLAYSAFAYRVFRGKTPEKGWGDETAFSKADLVFRHLSRFSMCLGGCDGADQSCPAASHWLKD